MDRSLRRAGAGRALVLRDGGALAAGEGRSRPGRGGAGSAVRGRGRILVLSAHPAAALCRLLPAADPQWQHAVVGSSAGTAVDVPLPQQPDRHPSLLLQLVQLAADAPPDLVLYGQLSADRLDREYCRLRQPGGLVGRPGRYSAGPDRPAAARCRPPVFRPFFGAALRCGLPALGGDFPGLFHLSLLHRDALCAARAGAGGLPSCRPATGRRSPALSSAAGRSGGGCSSSFFPPSAVCRCRPAGRLPCSGCRDGRSISSEKRKKVGLLSHLF